MPNSKKGLGWIPDLPDQRDFLYAAPAAVLKKLPAKVDLRKKCPKTVYDQGRLGSCTANAVSGAIEFDQIKQAQKQATPSRLFIYYNERSMEHNILTDSGAQIRDGIKSVAKLGACPESLWPYDDTTHQFVFRNSWGKSWGKGGYAFMPYAYLLDSNLSDDFWTIRSIE